MNQHVSKRKQTKNNRSLESKFKSNSVPVDVLKLRLLFSSTTFQLVYPRNYG